MDSQFWLWLTLAGMSLGAAAILSKAKRRTPEEESASIVHGFVPIIAAVSYFAMAAGQGSILLPTADGGERLFYFARYVDWAFTTPLLLVGLCFTAMHSGVRRHGLIYGLIGADLLMIVTALLFGLSVTPWIKWTWFAISCGAFLAVYYVLWGPLREENRKEREHVRTTYARNATLLSVIWLVYPLVLLVDPEGLGVIASTTSVAVIAVLDFVAKVVYGLLATGETEKAVDEDLRAGTAPSGYGTTAAAR